MRQEPLSHTQILHKQLRFEKVMPLSLDLFHGVAIITEFILLHLNRKDIAYLPGSIVLQQILFSLSRHL